MQQLTLTLTSSFQPENLKVDGACIMQQLTLTLTIDVDGRNAGDVIDDLAIDTDAGDLDQAALELVRSHLRKMGDFRDWRLVRCTVTVPEGR